MKIKGKEFLIGADPEFFVAKKGVPVSAYGLIPGDKKNPYKVRNGAVQVDGMALEFNINPAKGSKSFVNNINSVMEQILKMTPDMTMYDGCVAEFGADYINEQPEEARILGCEPDYNAYTGEANARPDVDTPFRTAAGHIHIGWTNDVDPHHPDHFEACKTLTKQLDFHLAIPSLFWDGDTKRRELYGQLGCFRPTHYGVEYRVLSNLWLKSDLLMKTVYGNTTYAIKRLLSGKHDYEDDYVKAQDIFENNDLDPVGGHLEEGLIKTPKYYRELAA
ncbi:MAG: hypothetical protein GQ574_14760 [Crocinitomix sp.]|nr:hypothetical protein [Crocinitomix sp.]